VFTYLNCILNLDFEGDDLTLIILHLYKKNIK